MNIEIAPRVTLATDTRATSPPRLCARIDTCYINGSFAQRGYVAPGLVEGGQIRRELPNHR